MSESVTTALGPWADFSRVSPDVLTRASERGKRVHDYCFAYLKGLWLPRLAAEDQPYFESFRAWADKMVRGTLLAEQQLHCDCYGYHGHPDWIGILTTGELALLDWKTPATESKSWRLQIAAYRHLVEAHSDLAWPREIDRLGAIMLRADGKPAMMQDYTSNHLADLNVFLAALTTYRYFNN